VLTSNVQLSAFQGSHLGTRHERGKKLHFALTQIYLQNGFVNLGENPNNPMVNPIVPVKMAILGYVVLYPIFGPK
jgi:hypothetical protein